MVRPGTYGRGVGTPGEDDDHAVIIDRLRRSPGAESPTSLAGKISCPSLDHKKVRWCYPVPMIDGRLDQAVATDTMDRTEEQTSRPFDYVGGTQTRGSRSIGCWDRLRYKQILCRGTSRTAALCYRRLPWSPNRSLSCTCGSG